MSDTAIDRLFRVLDACDAVLQSGPPSISLIFPLPGYEEGQVYLEWVAGRPLRDYIRDPRLRGKLSLHTAAYGRLTDQKGVKRKLHYVPQPRDEFTITRVRAV